MIQSRYQIDSMETINDSAVRMTSPAVPLQNPVIARRRLFSTAHFYEQKAFTPEKNREVFGACYSKYGHGHNYTLEVFVEGPIDPHNGLVINVNDLDVLMKAACEPFDHKHISFEHPGFRETVPTTENLAAYFFRVLKADLQARHPQLKLNRIRLYETDDLWATVRANDSTASEVGAVAESARRKSGFEITREFVIRSMHHLENTTWTPDENRSYYGMCYGLHGHDYHIQVTCSGAMDPVTGLILDRDRLDQILDTEIRAKYDGVNLNRRFSNTSCEQLAIEFYEILKPRLPNLVKIGIQETRKNYFEFPPVG